VGSAGSRPSRGGLPLCDSVHCWRQGGTSGPFAYWAVWSYWGRVDRARRRASVFGAHSSCSSCRARSLLLRVVFGRGLRSGVQQRELRWYRAAPRASSPCSLRSSASWSLALRGSLCGAPVRSVVWTHSCGLAVGVSALDARRQSSFLRASLRSIRPYCSRALDLGAPSLGIALFLFVPFRASGAPRFGLPHWARIAVRRFGLRVLLALRVHLARRLRAGSLRPGLRWFRAARRVGSRALRRPHPAIERVRARPLPRLPPAHRTKGTSYSRDNSL
jgi:hypothetical protein